ncbi:MAG: srkA [Frankiales bacterium]|nr:srkA [Frankiales bacterium]
MDITTAVVRTLLAQQHPDLAALPLADGISGWDNVMLRLGDDYVVRLPRRRTAVSCVVNEQRWLPVVAAGLPIATSTPLRVGVPSADYPYPWSIVPWLRGRPVDERQLSRDGVTQLARVLRVLHDEAAPADAPVNPYRGMPVPDARAMTERLASTHLSPEEATLVEELWRTGLAASSPDGRRAPGWVHGDVHPGNVVVGDDGTMSGLIDWGDICAGDPASDVAAAWLIADDADVFFAAYGAVADGLRERAAAWAAYFAVMLATADLPGEARHSTTSARALTRLRVEGSRGMTSPEAGRR